MQPRAERFGIQCNLVQRVLLSNATSCREFWYPMQPPAETFTPHRPIRPPSLSPRTRTTITRYRWRPFHLVTIGFMDHLSIHAYIRRISTAHTSITFLRLPPAPSPHPAASILANCFTFVKTNASNFAAVQAQISHFAAIKALVIDLFYTFAMEATSSLRIPVHYFFTSGAAVLALCCHLPTLHYQTTLSFGDMAGVELRLLGTTVTLKEVNMSEPMLDRNDNTYWDMLEFCTQLPRATPWCTTPEE
ncbi:hypothetical protein Fmac_024626 [Flemingia macrophylla]|uniref:Uncharacterized protein n=1 Tax=Flemingia macrophylla TaxID=520843 RepID=A0ABD1LQ09_9FABA